MDNERQQQDEERVPPREPGQPRERVGSPDTGRPAKRGSILRPLRTFKDDVAAALGKKGSGVVNIAAEEEKRRSGRRALTEEEQRLQEEIEREGAKIRMLTEQIEQAQKRPAQPRVPQPARKRAAPPPGLPTHMVGAQSEDVKEGAAHVAKSEKLAELRAAEKRLAEAEAKLEATREKRARTAPVRFMPQTPAGVAAGMPKRKLLIGGVSAVLIAAALGISFYVYQNISTVGTVEPRPSVPTLVPTNRQVSVHYTEDTPLMRLLARAADDVTTASGNLVQLYVTESTLTGNRVVMPAGEFMELLAPNAPGRLTRSLADTYTLGVYMGDESERFLVLETTFFENAFAGMLAWETTMSGDLSPLFGPPATRSAAPTPETTAPGSVRFIDRVVENKDVRILLDQFDNVALLYSFIDRSTLIIATSIEAFVEVHRRLISGRVVR